MDYYAAVLHQELTKLQLPTMVEMKLVAAILAASPARQKEEEVLIQAEGSCPSRNTQF